MSMETRLYLVEIGGNSFVVAHAAPQKAVNLIARALRRQMTARLIPAKEAYHLARIGHAIVHHDDDKTWPQFDDRTMTLPGVETAP